MDGLNLAIEILIYNTIEYTTKQFETEPNLYYGTMGMAATDNYGHHTKNQWWTAVESSNSRFYY